MIYCGFSGAISDRLGLNGGVGRDVVQLGRCYGIAVRECLRCGNFSHKLDSFHDVKRDLNQSNRKLKMIPMMDAAPRNHL